MSRGNGKDIKKILWFAVRRDCGKIEVKKQIVVVLRLIARKKEGIEMVRKRRLFAACWLAAGLAAVLFTCSGCGQDGNGENQKPHPSQQTEGMDKREPLFIGLDSNVMGYYDEKGWHSLQPIAYDEWTAPFAPKSREGKVPVVASLSQLLAPREYVLYHPATGEKTTANKVYIPDQLSLSGMDLTGNPFSGQEFYDTEDLETLFDADWQESEADEYGSRLKYFSLPVTFSNEKLNAFPLPADLFYLGFLDEENKTIWDGGIVLSRDVDGFPKDLQTRVDGVDEENALVQAHLDHMQMGDSDFVITQVWTADVDGDGKQEKVMIAKTPEDRGGYPIIKMADLTNEKAAVFILALLVKDGKATPLFYQQEPIKAAYQRGLANGDYNIYIGDEIFLGIETCLGLEIEGIFDFNGDGKFEICLRNICWDCPEKRVLEIQEDGSWQTVLYGGFGW